MMYRIGNDENFSQIAKKYFKNLQLVLHRLNIKKKKFFLNFKFGL